MVWITSGDASRLDVLVLDRTLLWTAARQRQLGAARMQEARAATALLGVTPGGQLFLGYPDQGLLALLTEYRSSPYSSKYTAVAAVPYPDTLCAGHPYTGQSLERDFAAVLARVRPTLILAPSPRDSHPDHRAAGLLTRAASARADLLSAVREWIVHGGEGWPSPRELMLGVPLTPAPRAADTRPVVFALEPAEEDRMLDALRAYDTQMRTIAPFLVAFVRTTELFGALTQADLAAP